MPPRLKPAAFIHPKLNRPTRPFQWSIRPTSARQLRPTSSLSTPATSTNKATLARRALLSPPSLIFASSPPTHPPFPATTTTTRMTSSWASASFIADSRALPLSDTDVQSFRQVPSLRQWFDSPVYSPVASATRVSRNDGENDLFAITLKTLATIPYWLLVVHDERVEALLPAAAGAEAEKRGAAGAESFSGRSASSPDMLLMLKLGQGVNGFSGVAHGGLLCALLDEGLSYCVEFARQAKSTGRNGLFTANLNVDFRRPVVTPGVAVVKCWITRAEGRKYWVEGQVEDAEGIVCVQAKGLWIEARSESL